MKNIGLKRKVMFGCIIFVVLLTVAVGVGGYVQYKNNITQKYRDYAGTVNDFADYIFEQNHMAELIRERSMEGGYEETRKSLNAIKERADIAYVFAVYFEDMSDPYSMCYVINGATGEELAEGGSEEEVYSYMGEKCGEDDFDEAMRKAFLESIASGEKGKVYYDNVTPEYGHMLTCYRVIYDGSTPVGILSVDEDVNQIQKNMRYYALQMIINAFIFMLIFITVSLSLITKAITGPITKIAGSVSQFVDLMKREEEPEKLVYQNVTVKSKDEIHMLARDVQQMAESIRDYITNLQTVTKEKERIGAELELATKIQADMLPNIFPAFPEREEFDIYATMTPAKEVGGDFYDFFLIDDDHIGLVMADVSGKGVPAALFMMMSKILVNNFAMMAGPEGSPGEVLTNVNDTICKNNEEEMFVTVWFGILTISTGRVVAANAGHEYPILKKANGEFELFKDKHGFVIGGMEGMRYKEYEFTLEKGGTLFLYTDGVAEATDAKDELFGTDRTLAALNEKKEASPEELLRHVRASVDEFVGEAPQFDDLTMLAIKLL